MQYISIVQFLEVIKGYVIDSLKDRGMLCAVLMKHTLQNEFLSIFRSLAGDY